MPLTEKGKRIKRSMAQQYGAKKGEQVFYASANKGTITGVEKKKKKKKPERVRHRGRSYTFR